MTEIFLFQWTQMRKQEKSILKTQNENVVNLEIHTQKNIL